MQSASPTVMRRGLIERVERSPRWCILIAPAGYGKTLLLHTLASQWKRPVVDAAEQPAHRADASGRALIDAGSMSAGDVLCWLDGLPRETRFGGRGVLAVRPPIDADALAERLGAHITVVGASRLAFERDEVAAWAQQRWRAEASEELIDTLYTVTAGWPALLERLAAHVSDPRRLAAELQQRDSGRHLWPFLREELLAPLSEPVATALQCASVFHEFDLGAVAAVAPEDHPDAAHVVYEGHRHGLVVSRGNDRWAFAAPILREALRTLLQANAPQLAQRALERGAQYLLQRSPREVAAETAALLVATRRIGDATDYMDAHAFYLLESVSGRRLSNWLASIDAVADDAPRPRLDILRAHVAIELGELREGLAALDRAKAALRAAPGAETTARTLLQAAGVWGQARAAARRGRAQEASAYARRGLSLLAKATRAVEGGGGDSADVDEETRDALRFVESGLLRVEARMLLRAGRMERAREVLLDLVERAPRPRAMRAARVALLARIELAWLALRRGDYNDAIEQVAQASRLVARRDAPDVFGVLKAIEAQAHAMSGDLKAARSAVHEAESVLRMVGPEVRGTVLLARGWVFALEQQIEEAVASLRGAVDALDRGGDAPARAEARIRLADVLVEAREFGEALSHLEHVDHFASNIRRIDPRVAGLRDLVHARIAVRQRSYAHARRRVEQGAIAALERAQARFELEGARALLVEIALAEGKRDEAAEIAQTVRKAIDHHGYHLAWPPSAARAVDEALRQTSDAARTTRRMAEVMAIRARQASRAGKGAKALRVLTPQAVRILPSGRLEQLLSAAGEDAFVIIVRDTHRAEVRHAGTTRTGDLRRVVLPLLRKLIERPEQGYTAPELVELVWGEAEFDARARTRLKVAISRLRDFLGPQLGQYLVTMPGKGKDRARQTRYAVTRDLPFLWVEPADFEGA